MSTKTEYLSKEKLAELKAELADLSTNKRREVALNLEQAKSLGDLKENAEYQEARAAQAALEERIAYLSDVVNRAIVVDAHHSTKVEIGSTVKIRKSQNGEEHTLKIVGSSEADMALSKVSHESPIGRAMLGKTKGDKFSVKTGKGLVEYEIVSIL
jgi:transcription elongation factor GreA